MAKLDESTALLDPRDVSRLGELEVISTRVVEGHMAGLHRSPFKGLSIEFAQHRPYTPGDELRSIDWRVYARSDRYYIKQFDEETNLQAILVLDASGSMNFALSTVSKLRYGQMAAAALARLMLQQRDGVGLITFNDRIRTFMPPRSRAGHLRAILHELETIKPGGETSVANILHEMAGRMRRRGLIILISDCFDEIEPLRQGLGHLHHRGHEIMLLHVMAPEEIDFKFDGWSRFECLEESGRVIDLDPAAIRKGYLERVQEFMDGIADACHEIGCEYMSLRTDRPLGESLAWYLNRRSLRAR